MAVLMRVPLDDGAQRGTGGAGVVLVEAGRGDVPGELILASPDPGQAAAVAAHSLEASLERLKPVLRKVREKLAEAAPEQVTVELGVKLGGETGIIVAKGTAEANLKITMTWGRGARIWPGVRGAWV